MSLNTYVYDGEAYWWSMVKAQKTTQELAEEEDNLSRAITRIRTLYEAGTPIFTKDAIQDVGRQLETCASLSTSSSSDGPKIAIKSLDGNIVDFRVESGLVLPGGSSALDPRVLERLITQPFISYIDIQSLTSPEKNRIPRIAYCSMRISHFIQLREKLSKAPVEKLLVQPRLQAEEFFQSVRNTWEDSQPCQQLRSALSTASVRCTKIVALALGPMSYLGRNNHRSALQHALLLTLQDVLGNASLNAGTGTTVDAQSIECYAQDPAYTQVDRAVLAAHGTTVLCDPKGILKIDDSTAVLSCSPSLPVKQIVSDIANPAIMMLDRVLEQDPERVTQDPDSPRLRKLVQQSYSAWDFTGPCEDFGDLVVYIRR